jgi:hypothetical protein
MLLGGLVIIRMLIGKLFIHLERPSLLTVGLVGLRQMPAWVSRRQRNSSLPTLQWKFPRSLTPRHTSSHNRDRHVNVRVKYATRENGATNADQLALYNSPGDLQTQTPPRASHLLREPGFWQIHVLLEELRATGL